MIDLLAPLAATFMILSAVASLCLVVHLYRHLNVLVASLRFALFMFFAYICCWGVFRSIYFIWFCQIEDAELVDIEGELTSDQLRRLGLHAAVRLKIVGETAWLTAVICIGDICMMGSALWMFPLIYEVLVVSKKSMDRGVVTERSWIRFYNIVVHTALFLFAVTEITLAIADPIGYTSTNQLLLIVVYFVQFTSLVFMLSSVVWMKHKGYHFEAVHGRFMTSPLYARLKRIMIVYAVFAFQFQLAVVVLRFSSYTNSFVLGYLGLSTVVYNATGLALVTITGCSLACWVNATWCCLPSDIKDHVETDLGIRNPRELRVAPTIEPPTRNPVFVVTDIDSSSALWAIDDGAIMQEATEIHDNLLRSRLNDFRGYEITTCGDSFQLAFHTVEDAVNYCVDIQLRLLYAAWPKELHNLVPATKKQRDRWRRIFCGLRVRMGIHQASSIDGALVCNRHFTTGKLTYTGASVMIANEMGELGHGGQILVTKRVAETLVMNYEGPGSIDYIVEFLDRHTMPQLDATIDVFQVVPWQLRARRRVFSAGLRRVRSQSVTDMANNAPLTIRTPSVVPQTDYVALQELHTTV